MNHDEAVSIYTVEDDRAILAVLPTRHTAESSRLWRPRKLFALSNYYSSLFGPAINDAEYPIRTATRQLAAAIAADEWDIVDLHPLDVNSELFTGLVEGFRDNQMLVQPYFCFGNWYLPVEGLSYDSYFASLSSVLRHTITRKSKKLQKSGSRFALITGPKDLEEGIRAYESIYRASWKVPEPYPEFMPNLLRICAEKGWLRLGIIYINDRPAAAQVWIVHGGRATIFKLAHDEAYVEYSVGTVLSALLMQHVLDVDKVNEVDFGSGDDSYKKMWLWKRRERWGIMSFNPHRISGAVAAARHVGGRSIKTALHKTMHPLSGP